jgi:hypothetical protein
MYGQRERGREECTQTIELFQINLWSMCMNKVDPRRRK